MGPQGDVGSSHVARLSALPASATADEGLQRVVCVADIQLPDASDVLVGNKLSASSAGGECAYVLGIQN